MTGAPLAGRRVVITRAADQAGELVERLTALGAEPLVVPLIQIVEPADGGRALGEALGRLGDFDWLVVTSPNGASRVGEALAVLGSVVATGRPRVAAVGVATATALMTAVDLVPERQIAEGLVDVFPPGDGSGRVLIAQAESARSVLADGLVAKGWQVETVVAYRTVPARPGARELLDVLSADAVLFASGSAVRSWLQVFGVSTPAVVVTIGPATAAVAEQIGLKVDAIAADHSVGGMLTSLLTHLSVSD
jgi:uroporphyrinogen-III synthase